MRTVHIDWWTLGADGSSTDFKVKGVQLTSHAVNSA